MGGQPFATDGSAAPLAPAVGAGVDAGKRQIQRGHVGLGLGQQVENQGPLEADGRPFGIVLVVGR
jgi:hypothetical protein